MTCPYCNKISFLMIIGLMIHSIKVLVQQKVSYGQPDTSVLPTERRPLFGSLELEVWLTNFTALLILHLAQFILHLAQTPYFSEYSHNKPLKNLP